MKIELEHSPERRKHRRLLMLRRRRGLLRVRLLEMVVREERHGNWQGEEEGGRGERGRSEREEVRTRKWAFWTSGGKWQKEN